MQLTEEQIKTVRGGGYAQVDAPEIGEVCVLIRTDRFAQRFLFTDEPFTNLEVGEMIERAMREYDADDPGLALYQEMVK